MPARREPRVEAEPHGGPPAVTGPDRFRPNPAELFEALEGALNDPRPRRGEPAPEWDGVGLPPSGGVDPATFWARKEK